ncbi:MAG: ABC transporter substrate-binding protein [Burkholderiales bacterium]
MTADRPPSLVARLAAPLALAALALAAVPAYGGTVADRVRTSGTVRVCIWPDYYGITFRDPRDQQLRGIDIDLSAEFAKRTGAKIRYVDTSFTGFMDELANDRCDVAMFAIGITAARQEHVRFSQPYLASGIYGVTTRGNRVVRAWDDIDRPGVRVAVQAGTFMEPAMAKALRAATLVVIRPPQTREQELEAGRVDVFMTDFPYSRRLLQNADWARLVAPPEPFNPVSYAYAVKPGDDEWLATVDAFVAEIKRDGTLAALAAKHGLGEIVVRR